MKLILATILAYVMLVLPNGQQQFVIADQKPSPTVEQTIAWHEDVKLSWDNFKANPSNESPYSAESSLIISYRMKISQLGNATTVKFFVDCVFEVNESWVKPEGKTTYLLAHEQTHFDIAEYHARKLRRDFNKTTFTIKNYEEKSKLIFNEMYSDYAQFQRDYDAATNHGRNKEEQAIWAQKVEELIEKSKNYVKQ
jgi:hypothetical protein